jgi:hypothetical protein
VGMVSKRSDRYTIVRPVYPDRRRANGLHMVSSAWLRSAQTLAAALGMPTADTRAGHELVPGWSWLEPDGAERLQTERMLLLSVLCANSGCATTRAAMDKQFPDEAEVASDSDADDSERRAAKTWRKTTGERLKRCGGCKRAGYCSTQCESSARRQPDLIFFRLCARLLCADVHAGQKADWARHKKECSRLKNTPKLPERLQPDAVDNDDEGDGHEGDSELNDGGSAGAAAAMPASGAAKCASSEAESKSRQDPVSCWDCPVARVASLLTLCGLHLVSSGGGLSKTQRKSQKRRAKARAKAAAASDDSKGSAGSAAGATSSAGAATATAAAAVSAPLVTTVAASSASSGPAAAAAAASGDAGAEASSRASAFAYEVD